MLRLPGGAPFRLMKSTISATVPRIYYPIITINPGPGRICIFQSIKTPALASAEIVVLGIKSTHVNLHSRKYALSTILLA